MLTRDYARDQVLRHLKKQDERFLYHDYYWIAELGMAATSSYPKYGVALVKANDLCRACLLMTDGKDKTEPLRPVDLMNWHDTVAACLRSFSIINDSPWSAWMGDVRSLEMMVWDANIAYTIKGDAEDTLRSLYDAVDHEYRKIRELYKPEELTLYARRSTKMLIESGKEVRQRDPSSPTGYRILTKDDIDADYLDESD